MIARIVRSVVAPCWDSGVATLGRLVRLHLCAGPVGQLGDASGQTDVTTGHNPDQITALAHSELLSQVPGDLRPVPFQDLRVAWLRRAVADGDIPDPPDDLSPQTRLNVDALLALTDEPTVSATCAPIDGRIVATVDAGDAIILASPAQVVLTDGDDQSSPRTYQAGTTVVIQAGPVDIVVRGTDDSGPIACLSTES